jgi:hypothetical protein
LKKNILRHEYKYLINIFEYEILKSRLKFIPKDSHCAKKGFYTVRSLYVEDLLGNSKFEKDSGILNRNKFRFRTYNNSADHVLLEMKNKVGDLIQKKSIKLSKELTVDLITDQRLLNATLQNEFQNLKYEIYQKTYIPKVIIQYNREAYATKDQNNLRINFDKLISSTLDTSLFFKNFTPQKFITNSQKIVLEIKYTHYLPDHIQFLLNSLEKSRISFSKYANSIQ